MNFSLFTLLEITNENLNASALDSLSNHYNSYYFNSSYLTTWIFIVFYSSYLNLKL